MAHSLLFREKFTDPESKESKTGIVRVESIPYSVLAYCYHGFNDGFISMAGGLGVLKMFQQADEYFVTGMLNWLQGRFVKELDKDNVLEVAKAAAILSAGRVKQVSGWDWWV